MEGVNRTLSEGFAPVSLSLCVVGGVYFGGLKGKGERRERGTSSFV